MKEETQNGPLMDQPRRQKGLQLPQITTVFGTVEDVLEQRTESNTSNNNEDDISGMVHDALRKARRATQSLSPHNQSSNAKQSYTSFFPALENMMATSRSTTLQHAQSLLAGNTSVVEGQREQPDEAVKTEETSATRSVAAKQENRSDFVIRKVEDEIANAKKVAQLAFNRVKCVSDAPVDKDVIDLTEAPEQNTLVQESFSQGNQLGAATSTWRSEGPNSSTWRSVDESERPLDSMMSDDYGLVYDYAVAASMSSVGHPSTPFCSLDNPIIRVMEHTTMNIIDLTNVVEDVPQVPSEDAQHRAVPAAVKSVGTEDNGMVVVDNIEKTSDDSKKTETKKTGIRSFPILPVKQESIAKTEEKSDTNKAETKTNPEPVTVAQDSRAARSARLLKLRQPMHVVKEDSHEESQGTPDEKDKVTLEPEGVKDETKDEDGVVAEAEMPESSQEDDAAGKEPVDSDKKLLEAVDSGAIEEPVSDQQVEDALICSVETPEDMDDYQSAKEESDTAQTKEASEAAKDQESLDFFALIDTIETADVVDSMGEDVANEAHNKSEQPNNAQVHEESGDTSPSLAAGFDKLFNFFRDKDEQNFALAKRNMRESNTSIDAMETMEVENDETISEQTSSLEEVETASEEQSESESLEEVETASEEQLENENHEEEEKETLAETAKPEVKEIASEAQPANETLEEKETETTVELAKPDAPETACEAQSANDALEAEEKETTMVDIQEEVADSAMNLGPRGDAVAVIRALGNFGVASDDVDEGSANIVEKDMQNDAEVPNEQHNAESKHPLFSFFDSAVEVRAPAFAAFGLGFMETQKNQVESPASPEDQQQYSANLNKSGESNEKNSLIEEGVSQVDTASVSMEGEQIPSPLPSQFTADDGYCPEPVNSAPSAGATEDFRSEAEQHEEAGVSAMQFQPLGSLYRPLVLEEELAEESTRVSLKEKYDEPPAEYSTRPTEDIINDNRVEAPIPQLSVLEPTDEIQKLQNSIMGESVTRRFNACGALKMFAANKSNQLALARTDGFFDALIVALTTDLVGKDREAAFGTRTRALEILLKICLPKENRVIIFYHPDLVEAIVNCAVEDSGEIRMAACSVFAMLAKSAHLREPMAQVDGLFDVLADSLLGVNSQKASQAKLGEVHEKEENYSSDEFSSGSDSDSDHFSTSGSETSLEDSRGDARRKNKQNVAKLKQKELEEKKKETTKQVTMSACATLLHLSKQCAAGHFMCHNMSLLEALLILSQKYDHPMHTRCLEILCNLTRLPSNNEILAEHPSVVPVMLRLATSENGEDRVWALRMLENISASKSGKQVLASTFALELLSMSVLRTEAEEKKAAMAALFNLSTDPGCLMAITNTRDVLSSLVLVSQDINTMSDVRLMACDMLSTIGLWFQKLAGVCAVPDGVKEETIPSNVTVGWNRWE